MFIITLLVIHLLLLAYIFIIALVFLKSVFNFLTSKTNSPIIEDHSSKTIDILVPMFNEGETIIDTVQSLVDQDCSGELCVHLLTGFKTDSSIAYLEKEYKLTINQALTSIKLSANRTLKIHLLEVNGKREKINLILGELESDYIALLDADHRAKRDWVSSSLPYLTDEYVAVQSRRLPLSTHRLTQLWDSAQNHLGNEMINTSYKKRDLSVFFTGTTCVFKAEILKEFKLPDSITEDTYLSYQLRLDGKKIAYNEHSGSYEEVAPTLKSYLARRRRWSGGHTRVFFDHFKKIFKTKIPFREKRQLLFHGKFYLIPLSVILLIWTLFIHINTQYTHKIANYIYLCAFMSSVFLCLTFWRSKKSLFRDIFVGVFILIPTFGLLFELYLQITKPEMYFYLIMFPYLDYLRFFHFFTLLVPLFIIIAVRFHIKTFPWWRIFQMIVTYPFFMFLDIYGVLLGLGDCLRKNHEWIKVQRLKNIDVEFLPKELGDKLVKGNKVKKTVTLSFILLVFSSGLVAFNDFTAESNCGSYKSLFGFPILYDKQAKMDWSVVTKKRMQNGKVLLSFEHKLSKSNVKIKSFDEKGNTLKDPTKFEISGDPDWSIKRYSFELEGRGFSCTRSIPVSFVHKELRGKELYINGEPFLVKGMIPNFSNPQVDLDFDTGFSQLKELGVNTLRIYHEPGDDYLEEIQSRHFLLMDQPDKSTWAQVDVSSKWDRESLLASFKDLYKKNRGNPFILIHFVGNELELSAEGNNNVEPLKKFLKTAPRFDGDAFMGYATYLVSIPYDVDILGVNMLDNGEVYWDKAFKLLTSYPMPFFASEFGGFVAHFEYTMPTLRSYRFIKQWNQVLEAKHLGAMFFQSHDNWFQPIQAGVNDPTTPDMPDDVRGVWDHDNKEKMISYYLKQAYSDLKVTNIKTKKGSLSFDLQNIRKYNIKNLTVESHELGDIQAGELRSVEIPLIKDLAANLWKARYTTHGGFKQVSNIFNNYLWNKDFAAVKNSDFYTTIKTTDKLAGSFINSTKAEIFIPKTWQIYTVNGLKSYRKSPFVNFNMPALFEQIESKIIYNGQEIQFDKKLNLYGKVTIIVPKKNIPPNTRLVMEGVGAIDVSITLNGETTVISCHSYRDCFLPAFTNLDEAGDIKIEFNRIHIDYLKKEADPRVGGRGIDFPILPLRVFSPFHLILEKIE